MKTLHIVKGDWFEDSFLAVTHRRPGAGVENRHHRRPNSRNKVRHLMLGTNRSNIRATDPITCNPQRTQPALTQLHRKTERQRQISMLCS
jgi:hypothetical protein